MDRSRVRFVSLGIIGLFAFVPGVAATESALDAALASAVERPEAPSYQFATPDLNGDSLSDAVVLLSNPEFCGSGGCTLLIFERAANGYHLVSRSTVSREPIYLLPEATHGWRTLAVTIGGGGLETSQALLRFDGVAYPLNPTLAPLATAESLNGAELLKLQAK
jgi:putative lipoprotein